MYFGSYPQTEVLADNLTAEIIDADYDLNGIAVINQIKYLRVSLDEIFTRRKTDARDCILPDKNQAQEYVYYKFEPIKWRVIFDDNGKLTLLSEYGLDSLPYNNELCETSWQECSLNKWLNQDFINTAFSPIQRSMIMPIHMDAENYAETEGNDQATGDKVSLLSVDDVTDLLYGFYSDSSEPDIFRRCAPTDYAQAMGKNKLCYRTLDSGFSSCWWLSTEGPENVLALNVSWFGTVSEYGSVVSCTSNKVRPVLKIDLSEFINEL